MNNILNTNKKEILGKGVKVFSIRALGYAFGFLFTWIIANKYGAYKQGVFAIAFLFLSIGNMISKLGIETALVKWIANSDDVDEKKNIFFKSIKVTFISSIIVGLIVYFCAPLIAIMYAKPNIENSIKLAAIAIPFLSLLDVSSNYFKGEKETTTFGVYFHLLKFLFPFLIILIFYLVSIHSFEAPIISYLLGLFLVSITVFTHIFIRFKNKSGLPVKSFTNKFIILESYPMMVSSAIVMIMGWSDVFILGFYVSEENIGIYSTAIKLATVVSFIYNAVATIAAPKIATYYKNNQQKELKETVRFSSKIIFLSSLPIFILIFCFPELVLTMFGEEYIKGKTVLRILLIAQLTNAITGPVGPIFQMTGKQIKLQNFISIALLVNIILSVILVNFLGLEGVAIASALGMILWNILGSFYLWKKMKIRTYVSLSK
jgi:O-antigen/teichoic acid export membrane protein